MPEKTEIEKEFGVDLDSKDLDIRKGIEAGIRIEEKNSLFYSHMTEALHNHELIHFFRFLSEEKELQKKILEKVKKSLEEKDEWIKLEYDYGNLDDAFQKAESLREKKLRMDAGDVDIITNAMKNEEKARFFFEKFADVLRGGGNDFFRMLSEREERHHDLLSEMLDMVKHSSEESE